MNRAITLAGAAALAAAATASADMVTVTIENTQNAGGFAFTPFWLAFHDGSFDTFDAGSPGGMGITAIAELGDTSLMANNFNNMQPNGVEATFVQPDAAPVFSPGESASISFDLDPTNNRFFQYASMVVPTNDLFVGNDDALELFDMNGNFNGPVTINIFGANVWDNGSEVNDWMDGAAFIQGVDATGGTDENGVVTSFFSDPNAGAYLNSIIGVTTADGNSISEAFTDATLLGTITIVPIAPVCAPASAPWATTKSSPMSR